MYYSEETDEIVKYAVTVDVDALQALRIEIINTCSNIFSYSVNDATDVVRANKNEDPLLIRDYQESVVNTFMCNGQLHEVVDVKFKYYQFPDIIAYIDALLNGNYSALYRIMDPLMHDTRSYFANGIKQDFSYYPKVQACITLTEVDRVLKSDTEKLESFFDNDSVNESFGSR